MKKRIVYMALCMLTLMTACSVKEGFIDKDCPEPGPGPEPGTDTETLRILFDWGEESQVSPDEQINVVITASGGDQTRLQSGPDGTTAELESGTYQVTGYENADQVTVTGEVVTVATREDGTAADPGAFSGGTVTAEVRANVEDQTIVIPMRWQTRQLIIRVRFEGEGVPDLVSADGYLEGVTFSRPINEGFAPLDGEPRHPALTSGTVTYQFAADTDGWYQGIRTLLGIDGDGTQMLHMILHFADGFSHEFMYDATREMDEFHTYNVDEPWVIAFSLNLGTGFEIIMTDWNSGPASVIIAE